MKKLLVGFIFAWSLTFTVASSIRGWIAEGYSVAGFFNSLLTVTTMMYLFSKDEK